jgi:ubiquinone/menaquinone biosynthesis C-methylase UbiE
MFRAEARRSATPLREVMSSVLRWVRWGLDRMVSVGYGVVYDYIFESFTPYQDLQREVLQLVEAGAPKAASRRDVRILDLGCGPGNFSLRLAEAGYSVVGLDRYGSLIDLAREKRRAKRLSNIAFQHADLAKGSTFREGSFDQIVNIHSLYVHPAPDQKLKEAYRILKPGGYAVFVNHTRRVTLGSTFVEVHRRESLGAALRSLLWVVPNNVFEATRKRTGPNYWGEAAFTAHLQSAGFTVLETRRTFLNGASLLVWARKDAPG